VLSPKCRRYEGEQHQKSGQEPRRSRRNLMEEDVENCSVNGDSDSHNIAIVFALSPRLAYQSCCVFGRI
jgi:hypothetical protein